MNTELLKILGEMDAFRRAHQDQQKDPSDYCMRVMEAIVARAAGFSGRSEWTDQPKADPRTKYAKDYAKGGMNF